MSSQKRAYRATKAAMESKRINPWTAAPDAMKQMVDHSTAIGKGLDAQLKHLIKVRASQINGCAVCLHMHVKEARQDGETDDRLHLLDAWHEAGVFTKRERAALAWTDALTRLSESRAPDAAYDAVAAAFSPEEIVQLTQVISDINAWNRIGVGFRRPPMGIKLLPADA